MDVDGTVLRVGVDARDREHRAVLSFDTSSLPDRAVITALTVRLHRSGGGVADPIGAAGGMRADVSRSGCGSPALQPSDFAARTVTPRASNGAAGLVELDLRCARSAVSRTGLTQMRLRFADPHRGDTAALLTLASGDATRGTRPMLTVQYGTR